MTRQSGSRVTHTVGRYEISRNGWCGPWVITDLDTLGSDGKPVTWTVHGEFAEAKRYAENLPGGRPEQSQTVRYEVQEKRRVRRGKAA